VHAAGRIDAEPFDAAAEDVDGRLAEALGLRDQERAEPLRDAQSFHLAQLHRHGAEQLRSGRESVVVELDGFVEPITRAHSGYARPETLQLPLHVAREAELPVEQRAVQIEEDRFFHSARPFRFSPSGGGACPRGGCT
jgi:hypothetical protein